VLDLPASPVCGAGVVFFSLLLFGAPLDPLLAAWGTTPLMAAVLVGAAQNVFSKSSKYSLFDPCKEMAYIPLDTETQVCLSLVAWTAGGPCLDEWTDAGLPLGRSTASRRGSAVVWTPRGGLMR
jgi:TLC ATP/ADP transporter